MTASAFNTNHHCSGSARFCPCWTSALRIARCPRSGDIPLPAHSVTHYREAYCPVPTNVMVCGLPPPASVTETAADAKPLAVGANVTVIVQVLLAGTLVP